jgi:peptidoglycan/LPS O-acetylase OafA/YrhL
VLTHGLKSIQRLRGIAVISVVLYHIWILGYTDTFTIFRYGHWGVHLFFMISGYIMIQKLPSYKNLLHFSRRRIRRLWPPLFITLLFSLPISFVVSGTRGNDEITIENYLTSLFMLNPMLLNGVFGTSLNYPFQILWTISVELTFYFVIALIYFCLGRRNLQLLAVLLFIGSTSVFCS